MHREMHGGGLPRGRTQACSHLTLGTLPELAEKCKLRLPLLLLCLYLDDA